MEQEPRARRGLMEGKADAPEWPDWIPAATRTYFAHTEGGRTIRELAAEEDVHPSTILRRVRRVEYSRDDPLVDAALRQIAQGGGAARGPSPVDEEDLLREALPTLRRLAEPDAVLAVARDLEKAVVARCISEGEPQRLAVIDRSLAVEMALRDWISCAAPESRIQRYRITLHGRMLLRRMTLAESGFAEGPAPFAGPEEDDGTQRRSGQPDSPLAVLARRRDGSGQPFLSRDLVAAGDRLREDLLLAQNEALSPLDWEAFLSSLGALAPAVPPSRPDPQDQSPHARVERALIDLGPGLADVALRTCCLQEGLEQVERRLGWSARSGKVVLRIALERLHQHYRACEAQGGHHVP